MTPFIQCDRKTPYLFPPSVQEWLPKDHLARFVVDIVSQLDLGPLEKAYGGRGSRAYHPEVLLSLLFYGYATGVFSSRSLERATYDSVAFRYITANTHPDHDTIASFRKRFLSELKPLFTQILMIAHQLGVLKLGNVSLDGTKVKANASKHHALSWQYACALEEQLTEEVEELLRQAEDADQENVLDGMNIPEEIARREDRLEGIAKAKAEIQKRAAERYAEEREAYEEKIAKRAAQAQATGKTPRGREPRPPEPGPKGSDQVNLTDSESRIMPTSGGGFEQAYNAQAGVDMDTLFILTNHVSPHPNDKQELEPALEQLGSLPETIGTVATVVGDAGYFSEGNVNKCEANQIIPYLASKREKHHEVLRERFAPPPEALSEGADGVTAMKHRLKTTEGRKLYSRRKCTVEPVFGIIKAIMGFRHFLLRGLKAVRGEWNLVCLAWNLKRLHRLTAT